MITDILGAGGKERRLTQLICALASEYHYHCGLVVLSDDIHFREIENSGIEVFKLVRKTKKDLGIFWSLYRIMMDFKPDVVQSWEPMVSFYALPVSKLQSIKFISAAIANARSPRRFSQVWILYKLTNFFSDAVVANSRAGLRSYRPPQKRSYCIHNGFDFKRTLKIKDPDEIRGYLGVETRNVVGMVAAFTDKKDYPTFIGAALALLDKRHELSFVCVGDGPKLEQIKQMVPDHYRDLIIFTGVQKDVESIINIFDVGVLATFTEGISNAIMEYMALGKPVVATEGGGTNEILADGITGYLVEPESVQQLIDKIALLIDNPETAREMGTSGKERLKREFSLNHMLNEYQKLYLNLIKS